MVRLAANLSFLWTEVPLLKRIAHAREAGFAHVEALFPYQDAHAKQLAETLQRHDVQPALFNAYPGDWNNGDVGLAALPHRQREFEDSVDAAIAYAAEIRCPRIHVLSGKKASGATEPVLVERLRWASRRAASHKLTILIEALNSSDFPDYLLPTTADAARIVETVAEPNCRLQLDLYHLRRSLAPGEEAAELVERFLPLAAHVQVANPVGRSEPGESCVALLKLLDDLGYAGCVGCEYKPTAGSMAESLQWAAPFGIHCPSS